MSHKKFLFRKYIGCAAFIEGIYPVRVRAAQWEKCNGEFSKEMSLKAFYEHAGITIYHGDCREILPSLPQVDLVLTDPPYGIKYKSSHKIDLSGNVRKNDADFGEDLFFDRYDLIEEKTKYWAFIFTKWNLISKLIDSLPQLKIRNCLVWDKLHFKMGDLTVYGNQTENILVFSRGNIPIFDGGKGRRGNVFAFSSFYLKEGQYNHPTQKPVLLCERFIKDTTNVGDLILDPFMGSGTTLVATKQLGRRAIGIEIEEKYCAIAAKRLSQEVLNFEEN